MHEFITTEQATPQFIRKTLLHKPFVLNYGLSASSDDRTGRRLGTCVDSCVEHGFGCARVAALRLASVYGLSAVSDSRPSIK